MDLPSTPYFLYFHYFGLAATHSHFSTSYTAHGLLFFSFRTLLSLFTSSRPICLSHEPVIHYSYCLSLMSFLSIYQLFSVYVAGLLLSTWAFKMATNIWPPEHMKHSYGSYVNKRLPCPFCFSIFFSFTGFLNSGPYLAHTYIFICIFLL